MGDLYEEALQQVFVLYDRKLGDGDVTAESLWPYPRHTRAEIRVSDPVPAWAVPFMAEIYRHGDQSLNVTIEDGGKSHPGSGSRLVMLEGNGQAILSGWQTVRPVIGLVTTIHGKIHPVVQELKPLGIGVTHNFDLPIGYDRLMRYAVEQGGGLPFPTGLDEGVYLTADHTGWAGSPKEAVRRIMQEIGESRNLIKVVVEITRPEDLVQMEGIKVDLIYCRGFTVEDVRKVKDLTKGWIKITVDETVPVKDIKSLSGAGIRMYMVNINSAANGPGTPQQQDHLSIRFIS